MGLSFFVLRLKPSIIGSMKEIRDNCCSTRAFPRVEPDCKFNNDCLSETCGCALGRIKKDVNPCKSCCVIPALTVDTVDGITNLANCLVHVTSINTTFYVDDKHRPMITWAGAVEVDAYDIETNPLGLRAQDCYTTIGGAYKLVRFDKQGVGHIMATEEE